MPLHSEHDPITYVCLCTCAVQHCIIAIILCRSISELRKLYTWVYSQGTKPGAATSINSQSASWHSYSLCAPNTCVGDEVIATFVELLQVRSLLARSALSYSLALCMVHRLFMYILLQEHDLHMCAKEKHHKGTLLFKTHFFAKLTEESKLETVKIPDGKIVHTSDSFKNVFRWRLKHLKNAAYRDAYGSLDSIRRIIIPVHLPPLHWVRFAKDQGMLVHVIASASLTGSLCAFVCALPCQQV